MGGRGASSTKGGGGSGAKTFKDESDFEKALNGLDDPRLKEYSDAYDEESNYTKGLNNVMNQAIGEEGYNAHKETLLEEERRTKKQLNDMPNRKTPKQLGEEAALKERLKVIDKIKEKKGTQGAGRGNINIT